MSKLELIRQALEQAEQLDQSVDKLERLPPHLSGHLGDIKHWLSDQLRQAEGKLSPFPFGHCCQECGTKVDLLKRVGNRQLCEVCWSEEKG